MYHPLTTGAIASQPVLDLSTFFLLYSESEIPAERTFEPAGTQDDRTLYVATDSSYIGYNSTLGAWEIYVYSGTLRLGWTIESTAIFPPVVPPNTWTELDTFVMDELLKI